MSAHIGLDGKVAIVTGASRGIGESIARVFAESGAKVVIASRKQEGLDAARARMIEAGVGEGDVVAMACHAGKSEEIEALFAGTIERFGRLDVLVNNAATNPYFGPLVAADRAAWDKTFEVNLRGYYEMARAAAALFVKRGEGGRAPSGAYGGPAGGSSPAWIHRPTVLPPPSGSTLPS